VAEEVGHSREATTPTRRGRATWPALAACVACLGPLAGCPTDSPEAPQGARDTLASVVDKHCFDPALPWALAHGILVRGRDARLANGDEAVQRLVVDNLPAGELVFPRNRGPVPVDAHPGLILKTLLEVGVPPERAFATQDGRQVLFSALVAAGRSAATAGAGLPLHNEAWQLEVHGTSADPALKAQALEVLVQNQLYFEAYAADPTKAPRYRKAVAKKGSRKPGAIHRYYCGGLHLFQAVQRLYGDELPSALARQYELLLLRLRLESTYWERALAQVEAQSPGNAAQQRRVILSQRLKLQGHALETYLRAVRTGVIDPTPETRSELNQGFTRLQGTVLALRDCGVWAELPLLAKASPQLYRDLVGDAAHALHAFTLADGVEGVTPQ
jgi:hypothetical protein